MDPRQRRLRAAAWCWIVAGVAYLAAEAAAASAFPGYSYATNYISDLGIPDVETTGGRAIDSPLHLVINVAFVLHGVLFATGTALAVAAAGTAVSTSRRTALGVLATAHGVGNVLVGMVHSGQTHAGTALGVLHGVGAGLAIVGGNLTAVLGGVTVRRVAVFRRVGAALVSLGVLGIVAVVALLIDGATTEVVPVGVWERASVYAITASELLAGFAILRWLRRLGGPSARARSAAPPARPSR